ncbi:MAG: hypothetical protein ACI89L_000620 [Phycisphaerales bacterium]|jgi:hypothetical protein
MNARTTPLSLATVLVISAATASAQPGDALTLDGVNDYAAATTSINLSAMTVEAWVNVDYLTISPLTNGASVATYGSGNAQSFSLWLFPFQNPDTTYTTYYPSLQINYSNGAVHSVPSTGITPIPYNEWHHIAATYDGATVTMYADGQPVSTQAWNTPINWLATATFTSGLEFPGASEYVGGQIDDLRLWSVVRSDADILASMASPPCPEDPDLFAMYSFDDDGQPGVTDLTGGGRDLVFINGATRSASTAPVGASQTCCAADLNGDGILDNGDIGAFIDAFLAGC